MDKESTRKRFSLERLQYILDYLKIHRSVEVSFLSAELQVSEVTIRKDLEKLENDNLLIRSHGGAILSDHLFFEPSFVEKEDKFTAEKSAIASEAFKLVGNGMTVALTTGTTISHLVRRMKELDDITVVTNAINVATDLLGNDGIAVFLTGGNIRANTYALVGETAERALEGIFVECAFIGVNGFSLEHGLTTPSMEEARVVRKVIENAKRVVVLADHSKFGNVAFYRIVALDRIHTVITDAKAPMGYVEQLRALGIEVIVA